jgi:hypothetical protein
MILNNRMVIGTFPYQQLRAIFQALVDHRVAHLGWVRLQFVGA